MNPNNPKQKTEINY